MDNIINNNMNVEQTLQLLGIQEVTTKRQKKNGTREFKLPVRCQYGGDIHVASFASGYVRRTKAGGYCPSWQLNKTKTVPPTEDYKWPSRERILILDEEARLDYLIAFCLKNYYIRQSNMLSSGEFIPKWMHEDKLKEQQEKTNEFYPYDLQVLVNGQRYKII